MKDTIVTIHQDHSRRAGIERLPIDFHLAQMIANPFHWHLAQVYLFQHDSGDSIIGIPRILPPPANADSPNNTIRLPQSTNSN